MIDFRQTFVTGASWDTDDLITFLGQKVKVQGHTIAAEAHNTQRSTLPSSATFSSLVMEKAWKISVGKEGAPCIIVRTHRFVRYPNIYCTKLPYYITYESTMKTVETHHLVVALSCCARLSLVLIMQRAVAFHVGN